MLEKVARSPERHTGDQNSLGEAIRLTKGDQFPSSATSMSANQGWHVCSRVSSIIRNRLARHQRVPGQEVQEGSLVLEASR